jgi:FkbM family methyltransferase
MQKLKQFLLSLNFFKFFLYTIYLFINKIKIEYKNSYYLHYINKYIFVNFHPTKNLSSFFQAHRDFTKKFIPKKNHVILDVGAGLGSEMLIFSKKVGVNGRVICLEPDPRLFKVLEYMAEVNKLKNVILYKKAFYKKDNLKLKFILSPIHDWMANSLDFSKNKKNYYVSTITINRIIKDKKIRIINFAKFNIEGAEKYLISGNKKFLEICQNIVVSCHDFLNKNEYQTYQTVRKVLKDHSFKIQKNKFKNNILKYFIFATKKN